MTEENTQDASVQATNDQVENSADDSQSKNADAEIDSQVDEMLSGFTPSSDEEGTEGGDDAAKEGGEVSEKPEDQKDESGKQEVSQNSDESEGQGQGQEQNSAPQPGRLDRRIAKLYLQNRLMQGAGDEELPDLDQVALEIQRYPVDKKKEALNNLLSQNKALRTGEEGDPNSPVDLSQEDYEAVVEAEAERRFAEMQSEIYEREWKDDLVETVDAHPELNESKKEYDPRVSQAVENFVRRGMKASEAYQLVTDSIATAQGKAAKEALANAEMDKQAALSGAVGASNDNNSDGGELTWEKLAEIQVNDPDRYMKIIESGKLPKK